MYYKLAFDQQEELKHMPETGMGYQLIEAKFSGEYQLRRLIVLNEELIVEEDRATRDVLKEIFSKGFSNTVRSSSVKNIQNLKLLSKDRGFSLFRESSNTKGAKENPVTYSDGKILFVRLSAFDDDKRIDKANNCLLPGSYTTTKRDYEACVNKPDDPVERYALPNDEKIEWAFHILPASKDGFQPGIVQPVFDKRGGGEECYFANGTSFGTFKKQTKYSVFYP